MTLQLGLIGHPIQHSLSPWIHRQFLDASGLRGMYHLYDVSPEVSLEKEIIRLKDKKVDGFNVTVPYKQLIIPYLDALDPVAKSVGAVNTVIGDNGKLIGHNTDGIGYWNAFKEIYPDFLSRGKRCLIIGAGGAARSIYVTFSKQGIIHMDIVNRTKKHAEEIALLGEKHTITNVLSWNEAEKNLGYYDILIQTTTVGMKPNSHEAVLSLDKLKEDSIVSDIIYQPIHTTFLKQAKRKGASILHGHRMLLYQAQNAFELWTKKKVEAEHLMEPLQQILEGR